MHNKQLAMQEAAYFVAIIIKLIQQNYKDKYRSMNDIRGWKGRCQHKLCEEALNTQGLRGAKRKQGKESC